MVSSGREVRADRVSDSTVSFIRSPLETTSAGGSWLPVSTSWWDTASRAGVCATALVAGAVVADTRVAALMGALLVVLASPLRRGPVGYVFVSGPPSSDDTVRVPAPRHASRADREG